MNRERWERSVKWYQLDKTATEQKLHVLSSKGLTQQQVTKRRKQFGHNVLTTNEQPSKLFLFIKQFQDFMVLVLLGATLIAGILGEYIDAIAIMAIVLINGCIGFFKNIKQKNR